MRRLLLGILLVPAMVHAEVATIATAANFRTTMQMLGVEFESTTGHELTVVSGSTGQLYAQILNGAPFDVFLAADEERPRALEGGPWMVAGSRKTYAVGRLAVVASDDSFIDDTAETTLSQPGIRRLAIGNPAVAPYGVASRQVLEALRLDDSHFGAVVLGENVNQVMTMVRTGNVDLGIVSLSLAQYRTGANSHAYVMVPGTLHEPVRQDAVLLSHGRDNHAAMAFMEFLQSRAGRAIIEAAGYEVEQ